MARPQKNCDSLPALVPVAFAGTGRSFGDFTRAVQRLPFVCLFSFFEQSFYCFFLFLRGASIVWGWNGDREKAQEGCNLQLQMTNHGYLLGSLRPCFFLLRPPQSFCDFFFGSSFG
jgi:hypothetical protein